MTLGAKLLVGSATLLALGACGQRTDVAPLTGQSLPPVPYGQETQPNSAELLGHGNPGRTRTQR